MIFVILDISKFRSLVKNSKFLKVQNVLDILVKNLNF